MSHRINSDGTAAVSTDVFWMPIVHCPTGVKVLLLTAHGVAIVGKFNPVKDQEFYTHWHPLPKKP